MTGLLVAILVVGVCARLILQKYKAQAVLFAGGFVMMAMAIILGTGTILSAKASSGFVWFDLFKFVENLLGTRTASLGMLIMVCAGFARYMDYVGASRALVHVAIVPLKKMKSPYFVLTLGFVIGQVIHLFIPSASGLGMLLMVTMYPIFIGLGLSRVTATAVIGTNGCLDLGPASGNSVLAAKYAGMTPVEYFMNFQLAQAIGITIVVAICHYFLQPMYAKKYDGGLLQPVDEEALAGLNKEKPLPPLYYGLLPTIPLILVMLFGYFKFRGINMEITSAMLIGLFVTMAIEFARCRDLKKVLGSIQEFFDGMGKQFAMVVTLIVAGETFAHGLKVLGAIDTMIGGAQAAGFGTTGMIITMSAIIIVSSLVMGSGNAPFFAFSAFAPDVAKKLGVESVNLLLPMQLSASVTRAMSPITAVIVAICGVAGVSPFDVVRRTAVPLSAGLIVIQVMTYFRFQ